MVQKNSINPNLIILGILGVGAYFALKPVLEATGLKKSKEDKETDKILKDQEEKINIWTGLEAVKRAAGSKRKVYALKFAEANAKAKGIYDSLNWYGDDEDRIYAIFRSLNYQTQVASIVDQYRSLYKTDLLTKLKSSFSDSELNEVLKIINQKPVGVEKI
jgi:hypothetical protein